MTHYKHNLNKKKDLSVPGIEPGSPGSNSIILVTIITLGYDSYGVAIDFAYNVAELKELDDVTKEFC